MKVGICGTIKNVGIYLPVIFENMEKIGSLFEDYVILLYYDYSTDNTLDQLKEYQEKNPKLKFYVNKFPLSCYRTHNIAKGRNYCLNMMKLHYSDYEYMIMMDCDDVCVGNLNLDVLKYSLLRKNSWDALSFNRKDYYDIWALSIFPYLISFRHFKNTSNGEKEMKKYITNLLNSIPKNEFIKCLSAFNGFAIYKTSVFLNCVYDGRLRLDIIPQKIIKINQHFLKDKIQYIHKGNSENSIYEDCEHRSFHIQAINKFNAKIRISPLILFN
jgi:hypothetical protein